MSGVIRRQFDPLLRMKAALPFAMVIPVPAAVFTTIANPLEFEKCQKLPAAFGTMIL